MAKEKEPDSGIKFINDQLHRIEVDANTKMNKACLALAECIAKGHDYRPTPVTLSKEYFSVIYRDENEAAVMCQRCGHVARTTAMSKDSLKLNRALERIRDAKRNYEKLIIKLATRK